MSQETRRRLRAREQLLRAGVDDAHLPAHLRISRYSDGSERLPRDARQLHVGRFSQGVERLPEDAPSKRHIGRFSDGAECLPDDASGKSRIGSYGDGARA